MKKHLAILHFTIVVFAILSLTGCENLDMLTLGDTNATPIAADFDVGNLTQTAGSVTEVTIRPKTGKSQGAITIYYNGSTAIPQTAGTYTITFDVAAATGWNAASGLSAETLEITLPSDSSIFFAVEQILDGVPIINDITISRTNTGGYRFTRDVSITASDYDLGSIKWEIAGIGVYSGQTVSSNGSSFTLDARDTRYNSLGIHTLVLTVSKSGIQYQRNILFTIVK